MSTRGSMPYCPHINNKPNTPLLVMRTNWVFLFMNNYGFAIGVTLLRVTI